MTDLFKSKREQIYDFIKQKGRAKTHEIIAFGLQIFYNRADRSARDLAQEGKIWRMREDLKNMFYRDCREDIWSAYEADR